MDQDKRERAARIDVIIERLQEAAELFPVNSDEYGWIDIYLTESCLAKADILEDDWEAEVLSWLARHTSQ